MKKAGKKHLLQRVRYWQEKLGLGEWALAVHVTAPQDRKVHATCEADHEYWEAVLEFDLDWIEPEDLDGYVVHELSHLLIAQLVHAADTLALGNRVVEEWVRTSMETAVVGIERAILRIHR